MAVKIDDRSRQVKLTFDNKISLAIRYMLDDVHRLSTPKTPKQHGNLRADIVKTVKGKHGEIVWSKNYAVYQEAGVTHGRTMANYTTPGTGPHFARDAVQTVMRNGPSYFKKAGM